MKLLTLYIIIYVCWEHKIYYLNSCELILFIILLFIELVNESIANGNEK